MAFKVGDIYEDCAYHPVICEEIEGDDIAGVSMLDGSRPRSCSLRHCGVRKMSQAEADKRVIAWKKGGERELMRLRGWTEEAIDIFMKEWR